MKYLLSLILIIPFIASAQVSGTLYGTVTDKNTLKAVQAATITINRLNNKAAVADSLGRFKLSGIPVGSYNIKVTSIGYQAAVLFNIVITSGNDNIINIELNPEAFTKLSDVTVSSGRSANAASLSTPLSVQRLTSEEIRSNPGGNFDISRVIQSLPGVSGTDGSSGGFRNDIIIRGGAPSENVFYLDGIEIPVINHFSTQGSGGGPSGILNVLFIQDVKLSTSAFDARFDNALSSVFQFTQKTGNPNRCRATCALKQRMLLLHWKALWPKMGKRHF